MFIDASFTSPQMFYMANIGVFDTNEDPFNKDWPFLGVVSGRRGTMNRFQYTTKREKIFAIIYFCLIQHVL